MGLNWRYTLCQSVTAYRHAGEATATAGYADAFVPADHRLPSVPAPTPMATKADHCVMMLTVGTTASGGITPSETLTLSWDEI